MSSFPLRTHFLVIFRRFSVEKRRKFGTCDQLPIGKILSFFAGKGRNSVPERDLTGRSTRRKKREKARRVAAAEPLDSSRRPSNLRVRPAPPPLLRLPLPLYRRCGLETRLHEREEPDRERLRGVKRHGQPASLRHRARGRRGDDVRAAEPQRPVPRGRSVRSDVGVELKGVS